MTTSATTLPRLLLCLALTGPVLAQAVPLTSAFSGSAEAEFGRAVAAGDGYVVVCSPGPLFAGFAGSATIFRPTAEGGWQYETRVFPSVATPNARFGDAIAAEGNRFLVGAPFDAEHGNNHGAVYAYEFQAGSWVETQRILVAGAASPVDGLFGSAIAIDGDTALIGAPGENGSVGAAYIYENQAGTWVQQTRLAPATAVAGGLFGIGLDIEGGIAMVGAPAGSTTRAGAGTAFSFEGSGASWPRVAEIPAGFVAGDAFGSAVGLTPAGAWFGAPGQSAGGGGLRRYDRLSASSWILRQTYGNPSPGTAFGQTIAVSGQILVVSAPSPGGPEPGRVHSFEVPSGFRRIGTVESPTGQAGDEFGSGVALLDDVLVAGAPSADAPASNTGAAHVIPPYTLTFNKNLPLGGSIVVGAHEVFTDPTEGGAFNSVLISVGGWGLNPGGFTMKLASPQREIVQAWSGRLGSFSFSMPPFAPGVTEASEIAVDVTISNPSTFSNDFRLPGGMRLQVFEVAVPPPSGVSIQNAIDSALPGTRIRLQPFSSYTGVSLRITNRSDLSLIGSLSDPSSVELFGTGFGLLVDGASSDDSVAIAGLQIRNATRGITVRNQAAPFIRSVLVEGNTDGGIDVTTDAAPVFEELRVDANARNGNGAGASVIGASATFRDCLFAENDATASGGGIHVTQTPDGSFVRVVSSIFLCNRATGGRGGGLHLGAGARARVFGNVLDSNFGSLGGGGISLEGVTDAEVATNQILGNLDPARACGTPWTGTAHTEGGGIYIDANTLPQIVGNEIRDNRASVGAGIFVADASNPVLLRNWVACNVAVQAVDDGPADFFGPGVFVSGSTFGSAAQPDLFNNTIADNLVAGSPSPVETLRGFGVQAGLMGQGSPHWVNNIVANPTPTTCSVPTPPAQGWAVQIEDNRFVSLRSNVLFGGLESAQGIECSPTVSGDTVCTTCCPLVGLNAGNLTVDPQVDPAIVAEVATASPAFNAGLPAGLSLPPHLYSGLIPVSMGYVERDGVLVDGLFTTPVLEAREAGSGAAVLLPQASAGLGTAMFAVQIDVDLDPILPTAFGDAVQVISYGVAYSYRDLFGNPNPGPASASVELPLRTVFNPNAEVALYRLRSGGKYEDTGLRSTNVDLSRNVVTFDGVTDFSTQLVGVLVLGSGGVWQMLTQPMPGTVNSIRLDGAGQTKLGTTFQAVSTSVTGVPGITILSIAPFTPGVSMLFGGTLHVNLLVAHFQLSPVIDGSFTASYPIPATLGASVGVDLYLQSLAFQPALAENFEMSNSLEFTICP